MPITTRQHYFGCLMGASNPFNGSIRDQQELIRQAWSCAGRMVEYEKEQNPAKPKKDAPKKLAPGEQDFNIFWDKYPKKVGKGKALESWGIHVVRERVALATVMAGLEKWLGSELWAKKNGEYITNPTTWINQHRWQDDPPPANGRSRSHEGPVSPEYDEF